MSYGSVRSRLLRQGKAAIRGMQKTAMQKATEIARKAKKAKTKEAVQTRREISTWARQKRQALHAAFKPVKGKAARKAFAEKYKDLDGGEFVKRKLVQGNSIKTRMGKLPL